MKKESKKSVKTESKITKSKTAKKIDEAPLFLEEVKKEKTLVEKNDVKSRKRIFKIYVNFYTRLFFDILIFILFIVLGLHFFIESFNVVDEEYINYTEKSNLDYKVYLKENDFYEEDYLGKDMLYVASLIDKVNVVFDYNFSIDKNVVMDFEYSIIGKLLITDNGKQNTYFEKEYTFVDNKIVSLDNNLKKNIIETVEIDYEKYNDIANDFKANYGVDVASELVLGLVVNKRSNDNNVSLNDSRVMLIKIPLTTRSVNIDMDYNEINNSNKLISQSDLMIGNALYMSFAVLSIVLSLVMLIKFIRLFRLLFNKNSKYDKYVKKLLNEYDRLIAETSSAPIFKDDNVIKIKNFQELVDVRDNLKMPIMYYCVIKHQKSYFYIMHDDKVYLHIVKAVDLEDERRNEKNI